MRCDLLLFSLLALLTNTALTNTAFPLSFDPVLIYFASGYPFRQACVFASVSSLCAGLAGAVDAKLLRNLGGLLKSRKETPIEVWRGKWFYVWVSLVAFSPLPFSIIRLALVKQPCKAALYSFAVGIGRLPRYLLTIYFWQIISLPAWINSALLIIAVAVAIYQWRRISN